MVAAVDTGWQPASLLYSLQQLLIGDASLLHQVKILCCTWVLHPEHISQQSHLLLQQLTGETPELLAAFIFTNKQMLQRGRDVATGHSETSEFQCVKDSN